MTTAGGQAAPRRVLLDTDIGGDIDDAWALAFLLRSPELALVGVTTVTGDAAGRAKLAVKLCDIAGRSDIPVAAGYGFETPEQPQLRFSADYTKRAPLNEHAVDFIIRTLRAEKEPLTIVPIGPLANIAEVLQRAPELKPKIAEIVAMAGSAFCGYGAGTLPCAEYNVAQNAAAAQVVFSSGVPITMVPLDCTWMLQPSAEQLQALAASKDPLAQAVAELTKLWPGQVPTLFDVAAVWACFDRSKMAQHPLRIVVDGEGYTRVTEGKPNTTAVLGIDRAALLEVCLQRLMP
jgi:inosine-uridine nucleoside N-ribohydrolase